ncbi:hypothetical protein ACFL6S_21625 [Candidatus Poribacteria bacterium]
MRVRNTMLAMDSESSVNQDMLGVVAILDVPESMGAEKDQKDDLDSSLADLLETVRDVMNERGTVAPYDLFEPGYSEMRVKWMIHYLNSESVKVMVIPPFLCGFNGTEPEITPSYVSDGKSDVINESQNLLQYLRSKFSFDEKKEILEVILNWFRANFSDQESGPSMELCRLVRNFNSAMQRVLGQDQI